MRLTAKLFLVAMSVASVAVLPIPVVRAEPKGAAKKVAEPAAKPASTGSPSASPPVKGPAPAEVLRLLEKGNAAFASGKATHPRQDGKRLRETASGQHPLATVLSCSDSRVPSELLFDEGIGDVFSVRVAGNVADTDELGTIEYGVDHLGTPLLVVLGHTSCGAVTAVATGAEVHGHIPDLVDNIRRAVDRAKAASPGKAPTEIVGAAIAENVRQSMADIISESSLVRARLRDGRTKMVGAVYHLDDGKVEWLGAHPDEAELLRKADAAPASEHPAHGTAPAASGSAPHDAAPKPRRGAKADHHAEEAVTPPPPSVPTFSPGGFALTAALGCLAGALSTRIAMRGS